MSLVCPGCGDAFSTIKLPRQLPCGHYFCDKCLVSKATPKEYRCLGDSTTYPRTSRGVQAFPVNMGFVWAYLAASRDLKDQPETNCNICSQEEVHPGTHYCPDCKKICCERGLRIHQSVNPVHIVVSIDEAIKGISLESQFGSCSVHPNEPYTHYSTKGGSLLCAKCVGDSTTGIVSLSAVRSYLSSDPFFN